MTPDSVTHPRGKVAYCGHCGHRIGEVVNTETAALDPDGPQFGWRGGYCCPSCRSVNIVWRDDNAE